MNFFSNSALNAFNNDDLDVDQYIEDLEKEFFTNDQKSKIKAMVKEYTRDLYNAKKEGDPDLVDFLKGEIEQLKKML